jgi:type IV secretion system protein VirB1
MRPLLPLLVASCCFGQDFTRLVRTCAPQADLKSIAAIVKTESGFRPFALSLNYPTATTKHNLPPGRMWLASQPQNEQEAATWSHTLLKSGFTLSIGLMQVSSEEGYSVETLLNPCSNLQIGWSIFEKKYKQAAQQFGTGDRAVQAALSLYNSGSTKAGFRNGYVRKVLQNAR